MMLWVEQGRAPDAIVAHQAQPGQRSGFGQPGGPPGGGAGGAPGAGPRGMGLPPGTGAASAPFVPRSRPVFPYPYVAAYDGKGDPNQASSYRRGKPLAAVQVPDWAGSDFYRPYTSPSR